MVCNLPSSRPEPFQSILADLQNKIDGLPDAYREPIQADIQKLSALLASPPASDPASQPPGDSSLTPVVQVLDNLIAGVVVFDQHGLVRLANDYAVSLFGFNPLGMQREALLIRLKATGENGQRVPNEQIPASRAAQGEAVPNQRLTITVPHGRRYHVLASAMPMFTGSEVNGVVSIWNDVTGLHNLDEEIRQQKDLLETVLNTAPYGMAILSGPDLCFRYTNRAFRALSPNLADPDGKPFHSIWRSEEVYLRSKTTLEQVIASGEPIYLPQEAIKQPNGDMHFYAMQIVRITWEKQPAVLVMVSDVTEISNARVALQQRAAEFQAIFESVSDPMLVFDASGRNIRANPAAIRDCGFDPTGMDRTELLVRLGLSGPDGSALSEQDLISTLVLAGNQVRDMPMRFHDASGRDRNILSSGSPLKDVYGKIAGAVVIWHDVIQDESK